MRLRPKEIEINQTNPFENDLLDRRDYIDNLLSLFNRVDESLTVSLSGKFGIGKTTLLRMLKARAESEDFNFETIYFNAWKSDYLENPFSSIISEINRLIPQSNNFKDQLKISSIRLLKVTVPAIIKAATLNMVDISQLSQPLEDAISTITSTFAAQELEKHIQIRDSINDFKDKLTSATNVLKDEGKVILLIIDELDRCKPTYAINILESIKHIFDVPNLNFLFALDYIQLSNTIGHVYGRNYDIDGYLRRFFDLQFNIPQPEYNTYLDYLFEIYELDSIIESRRLKSQNRYDKDEFIYIVGFFSKQFKATLRDLEKIINIYTIVLAVTADHRMIFPSILAFIIIVKMFDLDIYEKLVGRELTIEDIINYILQSENGRAFLYSTNPLFGQVFIAEMNFALYNSEIDTNPYKYFDHILGDDNQDSDYKDLIRNIKDISQTYRSGISYDAIIEYLEKKINFIEQLK
ncbi:P-loop NTPase fold protein [Marispirochaeta sp.]|uniref:KAP family P-loop NTPase fold protein n=1 Tax=Marispirochaeta sp. TaxID=2038653 RepID=UPI0029C8451C|nr:P-loop NTPase fold protein [Marispirochaeta sp.]